jgi:hypothetical protein
MIFRIWVALFFFSTGMGLCFAQATPPPSADSIVKAEGYQFDPNLVVKDPFEPPYIEDPSISEEDEMVRFDVKDMKLVAIMVNNHFHILQVGDIMGKARDTIFKIDDDSVTMEKILKDFKGNKKSQLYTLELDAKKKQ